MHITLDGREVAGRLPADSTLQQLINSVDGPALAGRLIVGVSINGAPLLGSSLGERLACPVSEQDDIALVSEGRQKLASGALFEAADALERLQPLLDQLAANVTAGRAADTLPEALAAWQVVPQTLQAAMQLTGFDAERAEFDGRPITAHLGTLVEKLGDLRDAFQSQDTVYVADLLRYEMPEMCVHWAGVLRHVGECVTLDAPRR